MFTYFIFDFVNCLTLIIFCVLFCHDKKQILFHFGGAVLRPASIIWQWINILNWILQCQKLKLWWKTKTHHKIAKFTKHLQWRWRMPNLSHRKHGKIFPELEIETGVVATWIFWKIRAWEWIHKLTKLNHAISLRIMKMQPKELWISV